VDAATDFQYLSLMDVYSGYHQIYMNPNDENKTAFIADVVNCCYKVMPCGLKNIGATYQCLMDKVFQSFIGRNIEEYIDDMVAKTVEGQDHVKDFKEIF
jgi:hypothetical protein